ncbi:MAG: glycosyltransferase 87 family protein, partial [Acidimicrobiia bacterium]|nr:glycosyltransferase 87 family protein [Acidimicrobiia bacterium]
MSDLVGDRVRFSLYFSLVCGAAISLGLWMTETPLSEDPILYFDRVEAVVEGGWPYVNTDLEHLPMSFALMVITWFLGGSAGIETFTIVFAVLMGISLFVSARLVSSIGLELGISDSHWTFLLIAGPLLPLVVFRNDPISLMFTAFALLAFVRHQPGRGGVWTGVAIAAKGWPVILALVAWWRGRRLLAVSLIAWTVGLVALLLWSPGFRAGRSFNGIHMETFAGSLVGLVRSLRGDPLGLIEAAGARYIDVSSVIVFIQAGLGVGIGLVFAWRTMRNPPNWNLVPHLLAGTTLALLLASPLLSAQFL